MKIYIRSVLIVWALAAAAPLAMAQSGGANGGAALSYTQALSAPGIRAVQDRLHRLGLYDGRIDGNWGENSAAALQQFQQGHGLQVTGQLNDATVKTMNLDLADVLGMPASNDNADTARSANDGAAANAGAGDAQGAGLSRQAIQSVQTRLRQLNFDVGPADGIWGADTQKALSQFQQGHGLQASGQLNPATIKALDLDADQVLMQNGDSR